MGLDCEVQYKRGDENIVVDSLSRQYEGLQVPDNNYPQGSLHSISVTVQSWMQEISDSYIGDTLASHLMAQL